MGQGRRSSGIGRPDIVIINANTCRKRKVHIKNNFQYTCVWRDCITVCWSLNIDAGTNLKLSFKTELSLKVVGLQFNEGLCVSVKFLVLFFPWIAHFKKEWKPGTQTKRARSFMGLFGEQVKQPPWIMTRHEVTSGNPRSARTYLCTSCVFFPVVLAPRQRSHLWSCFTVDFEVKLPQAHLLSSASHSHVFFFQFHLPFCYFELFNPAETFHFASSHFCLHSRPPK